MSCVSISSTGSTPVVCLRIMTDNNGAADGEEYQAVVRFQNGETKVIDAPSKAYAVEVAEEWSTRSAVKSAQVEEITEDGEEETGHDYSLSMKFSRHMSGTLHEFIVRGNTETRVVWAKTMVQGGESYRIGWSDVPDDVIEEIEAMGYERID